MLPTAPVQPPPSSKRADLVRSLRGVARGPGSGGLTTLDGLRSDLAPIAVVVS